MTETETRSETAESAPSEGDADEALPDRPEEVPEWDDEYLDSVALRLLHHYDLERDYSVDGERFPMYGELHVRHERHAIHPTLKFAYHEGHEHLFVTEIPRPTEADVDRLEALGDRLADEWVEADETHHNTDFTFAIVAEELPAAVRDRIDGYRNRNLIKFGYYGHYEINLLAIVPDEEESVASKEADVEQAFRVWEPIVRQEPSRLDRFLNWLSR